MCKIVECSLKPVMEGGREGGREVREGGREWREVREGVEGGEGGR